jgi:ubiquinone biosynthesis protein
MSGWQHLLHIAIRSGHFAAASIASSFVFLGALWRHRAEGRDGVLRALARSQVDLCNRLGATFIKVGQIASTRGDLLPCPMIEELSLLRDRVPPFAFSEVEAAVLRSLGRPLDEIYADFEREPIAAASVAQVHRAVHRVSGDVVAVKVRRPDILEKVSLDRSILLFVARNLERLVPSLRLVSLEGAVRHFCNAVEHQIHLGNEADHNRRFRKNFEDEPDVHFPELYEDTCSDEVLTMEFIDAIEEQDLETHGVDVHRVVTAGMRCVCRMIFLHGFVHSDLHPGNLRFYEDGRIALLDLGLVGELENEDRLTTARMLFAFATGDGRTVAKLFFDNAPHTATPDYQAYEDEVQAFVERLRVVGLGNVELTLEIGRLFDILRRHHIQARDHMTMVNIALATAEGLGKRLAPDLVLVDEALPYLAEAIGVPMPKPVPAAG